MLPLFSLAFATPDGSAYRASFTPLCTSDDAVVFLLQESDHDGTYYGAQTSFRWGTYDVIAHRWRFGSMLDLHEYAELQPSEVIPPLEKRAGKGTLAELLGPRSHCGAMSPVVAADFTYSIGPEGLSVRLGAASRVLSAGDVWTFDEVGGQPDAPAPLSALTEEECRLGDAHAYVAPGGRTLLVPGADVCDLDGHPLRILDLSSAALAHAQSVVLNQAGLDALRAGQVTEAAALFSAALVYDRTNTTAMYNVACALALGGDATHAVEWLGRLPREGLAAKLAADRDFDLVRGDPVFVRFVASL